jgi:hypothetical protein
MPVEHAARTRRIGRQRDGSRRHRDHANDQRERTHRSLIL